MRSAGGKRWIHKWLQRALEFKLQEAPPPPPPPRRLGYWLAGVVLLLSVIVTLLFIQPSYRERFPSLRPGGHPRPKHRLGRHDRRDSMEVTAIY